MMEGSDHAINISVYTLHTKIKKIIKKISVYGLKHRLSTPHAEKLPVNKLLQLVNVLNLVGMKEVQAVWENSYLKRLKP